MTAAGSTPLIVHVIYRLAAGGLENGLVNIVNRIPPDRYRHVVLSLTDASSFSRRITNPSVRVMTMNCGEGHSFRLYWDLWRILRSLHPDIVHSRNLATLESQVPAFFVPGTKRVHGEHGRDVYDLEGKSRKYNILRRAIRPLIHGYIAVSRDLADWLERTVKVPRQRIHQIYNGVNQAAFSPRGDRRPGIAPAGFLPKNALVVGTVGRLAAVKDQGALVEGFAGLVRARPEAAERLRLIIVGDGPNRDLIRCRIDEEGIGPLTWMAGERDDIPELLRLFDVFVLPSLGEGISNTVLEAMASGLPVVATRVGGNPELVVDGHNGYLVPPGRPDAIGTALARYLDDPQSMREHGRNGLQRVREVFDWDRCVADYLTVYDTLLGRNEGTPAQRRSHG